MDSPKPLRQTTHPPLVLNPLKRIPLLKTSTHHPSPEPTLPITHSKHHPQHPQPPPPPNPPNQPAPEPDTASIYFIGTATTLISHPPLRLLTDPNFLHSGAHIHLGPGVLATRLTDPAVPDLGSLPPVDVLLLSHYHEDHFDAGVQKALGREVRILTTGHAKGCLERDGEPFRGVVGVGAWEGVFMPLAGDEELGGRFRGEDGRMAAVRVTGLPGKHVPPGLVEKANELLGAVPPTNGWLVELGWTRGEERAEERFETGYRIYISGDTLMVDELKEIPERLRGEKIDLMLVHLGGTTLPGPNLPLLMVTMDGEQGVQLMQLIHPDVTVPIHFDDYDVFCSPLDDFKKEVDAAGLGDKVVYLDRGEEYRFTVRRGEE
ncbi:beta-lactamase-like protein [Chaetomium tenue]|uniref:Beta-lactamase-like protein n=1 Tax=Chaetomium tenue TaxID=1854479 RepID=A0ACB7P505_9PEZI|nr:beta-lactamase-like protein [Chaetomium globosum]